jgi:uncharacterized protein (TIGR02448 family)
MSTWKTLGVAFMASLSAQVVAEVKSPGDQAMIGTTLVPSLLSSATTNLTTHPNEYFGSAKADALAFIGSDGQIRGVQFERASRYYRTTYSPPLMSDQQLALAIAASF